MAVKKPLLAPVWAETGETVRPTDAEISEGWPLSATPPSRQRFNWILGWLAQNVAYLRQSGIPPWDPEEGYPADAVVIHNHGLWVSKRKNTNVEPGTSPDDWAGAAELLGGVVQKIVAGTGVAVSPVEGTGEVTISATGDGVVQKIVAGTGVTVSPVKGTGEVTISATGGVKEIVAGDNITIEEADGVVTINATDQSGGGTGGVGKIIAGAGISVNPASGTGDVTISSTVSAPTTGGKVADIGAWRIIVGTGTTITGYLDTVTMPKPLGAVLAIGVTEYNAVGWGPPGPNGEVTGTVTAFGTMPHPDPDKFKLSVATLDVAQNKWFYPGLTSTPGGVGIQYIAIGENPDYVPPKPAP